MAKKILVCEELRKIDGPYSYGVLAGEWAFTSGMLPFDGQGRVAGSSSGIADAAAQVEKSLSDLVRVFEVLGLSSAHVAKLKSYLSDVRHKDICQQGIRSRFSSNAPAQSYVGAFLPDVNAVVQIEGVATSGGSLKAISGKGSGGMVANKFAFSNFQEPAGEDGKLIGTGNLRAQVEYNLDRIGEFLAEAGLGFEDVIKVNGTVPAWYGFNRYTETFGKYFTEPFPARATVEGKLATQSALIGFEVVAAKDENRLTVESEVTASGHFALKKREDTIYVPELPAAMAPHSHAVKIGDVVYICGQIPYEPSGLMVGWGDIREQTRKTMENLKYTIEAVGGQMNDIVKTNVSLTDPQMAPEFYEEYAKYFSAPYPAMTLVGAVLAQDSMVVEVEAIAVLGAADNAKVVVDK